MAQRPGRFFKVADIVAAFIAQGCTIKIIDDLEIHGPDGDLTFWRQIERPDTGAFVAVIDLADAESIPVDEVIFWERRLGLTVLDKL
ncbi:MAG TPA: hypothetical protein VG248_02800 [Caulobacteraceae bacterium]|jgi:hypothetical protein|nr:hypothetical protein [Caulobacteraceae bacterium]